LFSDSEIDVNTGQMCGSQVNVVAVFPTYKASCTGLLKLLLEQFAAGDVLRLPGG
jgi:hypothetical protein